MKTKFKRENVRGASKLDGCYFIERTFAKFAVMRRVNGQMVHVSTHDTEPEAEREALRLIRESQGNILESM